MRSARYPTTEVPVILDQVDQLISGCLASLMRRHDNVTLRDFARLLEIRYRIAPEQEAATPDMQSIEAARAADPNILEEDTTV